VVEEPAFALDASAISSERSVRSYDAVTRNYDGDGVVAVGCADGPDCVGMTDAASEFSIGCGRATRYVAQFLPDLTLERRASGGDRDRVDRG